MLSNNKIEIESTLKFLKCFKCEVNRNLIPYPIDEIHKSKIKKFRKNKLNVFIPICLKCSLEFQRWKRFNKNYKRKNIESLVYIITTFSLIWVMIENFWVNFSLLILIIGILINYNFQSRKYQKKMEFYPKKYIYYSKDEDIYIKPENSLVWIPYLEWIREIMYEGYYQEKCEKAFYEINQDSNILKCIHCGVTIRRFYTKCHKCGNLLPLRQI